MQILDLMFPLYCSTQQYVPIGKQFVGITVVPQIIMLLPLALKLVQSYSQSDGF